MINFFVGYIPILVMPNFMILTVKIFRISLNSLDSWNVNKKLLIKAVEFLLFMTSLYMYFRVFHDLKVWWEKWICIYDWNNYIFILIIRSWCCNLYKHECLILCPSTAARRDAGVQFTQARTCSDQIIVNFLIYKTNN